MAGKKRAVPEENKVSADYYKLHTDAVNDLVHADESNSPEVSEEELRKYRSGSKWHLSDTLKAILIKMWFAGSVCFFIFWGLSAYIGSRLDLMVVFGIVLGIVTDLLTNNFLRHAAKTEHANDRFMMFPKRSNPAFLLNIIYALILLAAVSMVYNVINLVLYRAAGTVIGVEPILFGVIYTGVDLLLISMKRLAIQIVRDARRKEEMPSD